MEPINYPPGWFEEPEPLIHLSKCRTNFPRSTFEQRCNCKKFVVIQDQYDRLYDR